MMDDWIDKAPRLTEAAIPQDAAAFDTLLEAARPVVLRGLAADWPAVAAAGQGHGAMAAYLRRFDGGQPLGLFAGPPGINGRFFYRDDMTGFNFERGQIPLPVLLDALQKAADEPTPPAFYAGASAARDHFPGWTRANVLPLPPGDATARVWIGNGSRVSAHFDMASNVAVVVAGRRRVVLFPPEQIANLYIGPLDVTMAGQPATMVDIERPDFDRFPRFAEAQRHAVVAELEPGDAILIPTLWWHEIRASGALNVLVNYWWTRGTPDAPFLALVHAILAVRDRPAVERAALRTWFDHYVFADDAPAVADHLPAAARGILAPPSADRDARIRGYLRQMLGG